MLKDSFKGGIAALTSVIAIAASTDGANAQDNVVGVCSGVSLERSVVTDIVAPVVEGIATPTENTVNSVLDVVEIIPIVGTLIPDLSLNASDLLSDAAAGDPITLRVLNENGDVVGPADDCDAVADSYRLTDSAGLSIGGNRISGLGDEGRLATAGEIDSIAFGNNAQTDASALSSIAIGTDASVGAAAVGAIALGDDAVVDVANSVAIGAGSRGLRGMSSNYTALGLPAPQSSVGEVSFGAVGAERQLTNIAAGSADTDAVNISQLRGVAERVDIVETASALSVQYDSAALDMITLGMAGTPVIVTNVADGSLAAGSTDAVTGGQVNALGSSLATNLGGGASFDETAGSVTAPNYTVNGVTYSSVGDAIGALNAGGGGGSGDLGPVGTSTATLIGGGVTFNTTTQQIEGPFTVSGTQYTSVEEAISAGDELDILYDDAAMGLVTFAGAGGTRLTNLLAGTLSAGSTDAVTGAQLFATNQLVDMNIQSILDLEQQINNLQTGGGGGSSSGPVAYADPSTPTQPNDGTPTDNVTMVGASGGPVTVSNVANGDVRLGSTEAVNGGQLWQTNQNVATAQATADQALTLSANAVQYDAGGQSVTFGPASGPVRLHNVDRGVAPTDAVNVQQLNEGLAQAVDDAVGQANAYTDSVIAEFTYGLESLERRANAGTASALAAASLPQAVSSGRTLFAMGVGFYENQNGVAIGVSHVPDQGRALFKLGGNYDSQGRFGASAGVGWQF